MGFDSSKCGTPHFVDEGSSVLLSVCAQVGSFAFLLTLVFNPRVLTAFQSGDVLIFDPLTSAVASALAMAIWGLFCVFSDCLSSAAKCFAQRLLLVVQVAFPVFAAILLISIRHPVVPIAVSFLLGVACMTQVYLFSRSSRLDSRETLLTIGLCIGIAGLFSDAVYSAFSVHMFGSLAVSLLMAFSGAVIVRRTPFRDGDFGIECVQSASAFEGIDGSASVPEGVSDGGVSRESVRESIASGFPALLGSLMCSVALGTTWDSASIVLARSDSWMFALGILSSVTFIFIFSLLWQRIQRADLLVYAFAVPLSFSVVLYVFSDCWIQGWYYVLSVSSAVLFLAFMWSGALLLDRSVVHSGAVACGHLAFFSFSFGVSMFLGSVLDRGIVARILPLIALAFFLFLVSFAVWRGEIRVKASCVALPIPSVSGSIRTRCDEMAGEFGLSAREAELLPLFVMGMSSTAIGSRMFISPKTVKTHRYRVYQKMGVSSHEELVALFDGSI